jgi:hypothetical protein
MSLTGGPAFPASYYTDDGEWVKRDGMTLRDYFAAKAVQGLLSGLLANGQDIHWSEIARNAYWQADAMLKAREHGNS